MAGPFYCDATTPGDGTDGLTWAKAEITLAAACTDAAAGERVWSENGHVETAAGVKTITMSGTIASPSQILCGDKAAEPPTALSTGAQVITTGANALSVFGSGYIYGHTFSCGSTGVTTTLTLGNAAHKQVYESCVLTMGTTGNGALMRVGAVDSAGSCDVEFVNSNINFGATGQRLLVTGRLRIRGGAAVAGAAAAQFLSPVNTGESCEVVVDGFDFSAWATALNLVIGGAATQSGRAIFRHCKLPASWSGLLVSTMFTTPGFRAEMWNCSAGSTNYEMRIEDYCGSIRDETTIVRSGGASDGTTPLSWKMVGSANLGASGRSDPEWGTHVLRSPEIFVWNDTTGSSKTLTVEIVQNHATVPPTALQDDEVWLEVQYLGTSGTPLSLFADDAVADIMGTPANQATSSVTWNGTTQATKQALSVAVTPQKKGMIIVTVCLAIAAIASTSLYIDPVATVT